MANTIRIALILNTFILMSACAPGVEEPPAPPQEALICPADGYLNCMPIVPPERQNFCSAEYRTWIVNNCPNVEIVY